MRLDNGTQLHRGIDASHPWFAVLRSAALLRPDRLFCQYSY